jgi:hypothetical protein
LRFDHVRRAQVELFGGQIVAIRSDPDDAMSGGEMLGRGGWGQTQQKKKEQTHRYLF